jgi:hypothetical protein
VLQALAEALQQEMNRRIAGGEDYREACLLSELKSKFLYTSMSEVHRKNRGRAPARAPAASPEPVVTAAREIAEEAAELDRIEARTDPSGGLRSWPWTQLARIATAILGVAVVVGLGVAFFWNANLEHFDRDQLDQVSPYLSSGARSGEGAGTGFVGGIRDAWSALGSADRMLVATDLVEALREQGVREIMIYDNERRLRIQALGTQPARVLPVRDESP